MTETQHDDHTQGAESDIHTDWPANDFAEISVEDVLAEARLPERWAHVCLRPDLMAEHDRVLGELSMMVDSQGNILEDVDPSLAEGPVAEAAQSRANRLRELQEQMRAKTWHVLFRGMNSDDIVMFERKFRPTKPNADMTEFNLRLVAQTAVSPAITLDQLHQLRTKLGNRGILELVETARRVVYSDGVDVPKSPGFLANLGQQ